MLSLVYDVVLVAVGFFAGDYVRKNFPSLYADLLAKGVSAYTWVRAKLSGPPKD